LPKKESQTIYVRAGKLHLACTPGSAPGRTLGNEYGKPLSIYRLIWRRRWEWPHRNFSKNL